MVAWRLTLFTPHYPNGRDIIVIGNDITTQIGSFGPQEDLLFKVRTTKELSFLLSLVLQKASDLSREEGLPRIYIAANSGARIGLADEIKHLFQVAWVDPNSPEKGFKYLYLSPADYMRVLMNGWMND